jgi:hypothetical protein
MRAFSGLAAEQGQNTAGGLLVAIAAARRKWPLSIHAIVSRAASWVFRRDDPP